MLAVVISFALLAIFSGALDGRGFLASVAVGYSILIGGGWEWFLIVAVFFVLGVAFTWYKYSYKQRIGSAQEKGGARNWPNILANGGAAAIFAIFELFFGGSIYTALFLGSICAAASDTVATELGLLSDDKPRLITRLRSIVPPGTSGGVTSLGLTGALLASVVIGVLATFLNLLQVGLLTIAIAVAGGLSGSLADSIIGATIQRKGYCVICMKNTEALKHCGERTKVTDGIPFIENNIVNLLATFVGASASLLIAYSMNAL